MPPSSAARSASTSTLESVLDAEFLKGPYPWLPSRPADKLHLRVARLFHVLKRTGSGTSWTAGSVPVSGISSLDEQVSKGGKNLSAGPTEIRSLRACVARRAALTASEAWQTRTRESSEE